jgi:hypothetical protein
LGESFTCPISFHNIFSDIEPLGGRSPDLAPSAPRFNVRAIPPRPWRGIPSLGSSHSWLVTLRGGVIVAVGARPFHQRLGHHGIRPSLPWHRRHGRAAGRRRRAASVRPVAGRDRARTLQPGLRIGFVAGKTKRPGRAAAPGRSPECGFQQNFRSESTASQDFCAVA